MQTHLQQSLAADMNALVDDLVAWFVEALRENTDPDAPGTGGVWSEQESSVIEGC